MKDLMQHRGYYGSVHFDDEELIFHGKIEFIRALVTFEAIDAKGLRQAFEEAVEDYFDMCERNKIEPEKPFKGSFNIRVKPDVHRMLAIAAQRDRISINKYISETLEKAVRGES
jgi:predicted HicB family RNase H-like nuclease